MKSVRLLGLPLLALAVSMTSGCFLVWLGAGVGAGVAGVAYVEGEMRSTEAVTLEAAQKASLAAVKEMGYTVTKDSLDALEGVVEARTADDSPVKVSVKRTPEDKTEIRARVGRLGDKDASGLLMQKIRGKLGSGA